MLTKDLLKYKRKGQRIHPSFVDVTELGLNRLAKDMCQGFANGLGKTLSDIDKVLPEYSDPELRKSFKKLLTDRCEFDGDSESFAKRRWQLIKEAQSLRINQEFSCFEDFQKEFATGSDFSFGKESPDLYGDLAEFQKLQKFKEIDGDGLLHRYNCALIQGMLLYADEVILKIKQADLKERRSFFRQLKFARLLVEVVPAKKAPEELTLRLSGPLNIFQSSQSYGMRLANFFPYILLLPKWELDITLMLKKAQTRLRLDETCGIRSHYQRRLSYIPEEYGQYMQAFNSKEYAWQMTPGEDMLHLGDQTYCFPDFMLHKTACEPFFLELFHPWHSGQLRGRLELLIARNPAFLIVGIHKSLFKAKDHAELIENAKKAKVKLLEFNEFPLSKSILDLLESN